MARPKIEIDAETVKKLAALNCSMEEIGHIVGCSVDTLERRFAEAIKEGRSHGKVSLKRKMYDTAIAGNVTMMIWLSKNLLGYTDKIETKEVSKEDTKSLVEEAKKLTKELDVGGVC
jgi:hypothetical protein